MPVLGIHSPTEPLHAIGVHTFPSSSLTNGLLLAIHRQEYQNVPQPRCIHATEVMAQIMEGIKKGTVLPGQSSVLADGDIHLRHMLRHNL